MIDDYVQCVARALELIPTHRHNPKRAEQLALELAQSQVGLSESEATGMMKTLLALLDVLGVLSDQEDGYRLSGQVPTYFLQSLKWYFVHEARLFDNWNARRARGDGAPPARTLLEDAPDFLRLVEQRRLQLAGQRGLDATPVRTQEAVLVLIKAVIDDTPHFLHQYDERAGQYQVIGGRIEPDETMMEAAMREFIEEVGAQQEPPLQGGRDFTLAPLLPLDEPIRLVSLSPTYGVLTRYAFYVCTAHFNIRQLKLTSLDRWLSVDEMLRGRAASGESLGNTEISLELDRRLPGGLRGAPIPALQL